MFVQAGSAYRRRVGSRDEAIEAEHSGHRESAASVRRSYPQRRQGRFSSTCTGGGAVLMAVIISPVLSSMKDRQEARNAEITGVRQPWAFFNGRGQAGPKIEICGKF